MWKTLSLSLLVLTGAPALSSAEEPGTPASAPVTAPAPAPMTAPTTDEATPPPAGKDDTSPSPSSKTDLMDPFADPEPPHSVTAEVTTKAKTAQTTLSFRNDAGPGFTLSEARFFMDGKELPTVIADPERGKSYVIYSGPVAAGQHLVTVKLVYQGQPRGAFNYMKGYKLNVSSDGVFTTPEDRSLGFTIVSKEQKGINVPLERRINVGVESVPTPR